MEMPASSKALAPSRKMLDGTFIPWKLRFIFQTPNWFTPPDTTDYPQALPTDFVVY